MKKIVSIEEKDFDDKEGFVITLDTGELLTIGISSGQDCCETFGAVCSEDKFDAFIGAELLSYDIVDQDLAVKKNQIAEHEIYPVKEYSVDQGDIVFLNVNTSQGMLQFTVYNCHNGYYGHWAEIRYGEQIIFEDSL